jgi:hypothetical protein
LKTGAKFSLLHLLWMIPVGLVVIALFIPAPRRSREAARRTQCKNNLKQIGLALHNYHDVYGAFPPAYTVDANGKRLHSWRTLILPFVDQAPLYEKINLSKAWDDPANAEAAKTMLSIYHCPSSRVSGTGCSYVAIVGAATAFPGPESKSIPQITDGASNTILVVEVESEKSVPWMSPTDVDEQYFLNLGPKSKVSHTGGLHALMGDGSVRFFSYNMDGKVRQAQMTIDAGDAVGEF